MRFASQPWEVLYARLEIIVAGLGQVGLAPTVAIQRLADNQWLAAGGGAWGAGFAVNNLVEVDAANQPGLYEYAPPLARLDMALGSNGYRMKYVEATTPVLEYEYVLIRPEFSGISAVGLATAGSNTSATFGVWAPATANFFNDMLVAIVSGTGRGQTRRITAYSGARVATIAPNWGTNPDATSVCAVHAGGAADVRGWNGSAPNALVAGRVDADVGNIQPGARDAIADQVWDEILSGHAGAGSTAAALTGLFGVLYPGAVLATGTVASTTGTTTTLDVGSAATASYYIGARLVIIGGTGLGQERILTDYSAGRVATHAAWATNPTGASKYAILGARVEAGTAAAIADAVWDESSSGHVLVGSFGDGARRTLGLRQSNNRVIYDTWNANGDPSHGLVYIYDSKADLEADVSPWLLATGKYEFDATYDGSLRLTSYTSTRES